MRVRRWKCPPQTRANHARHHHAKEAGGAALKHVQTMQGTTTRRGRGRGKGRGKGRGREGYPIGTSASALAFAHSLLDDRSAPATASVLLLSWVPAWKQLVPHGPPNRREGEVRRCGGVNVTFSTQRELLRHGGFDAIALIHHVRSMQREQPLPHGPRAVNVMYSIEPPGWKPKLEPTHLAAFTRRFSLALSYEQARRASRPVLPGASARPSTLACVGRQSGTPRRRTSSRTMATRSSGRSLCRGRDATRARSVRGPTPALPAEPRATTPAPATTPSAPATAS